MMLKSLLVVDPVANVSQDVAAQCARLAETRIVAQDGRSALEQARALRPEMLLLSLETRSPDALELAAVLKREMSDLFVIATHRELSVPTMERLSKLGIEDFVAQPIDFAAVFRAASRHFGVPFRRHDRHSVALDLTRLDGVLIGRTRDLSEGGMLFDAHHPLRPEDSVLVDIGLPARPLRVRCHILAVDGEPPKAVQARGAFQNLRGPELKRLVDYLGTLPHDDTRGTPVT